jgi:uncharacterized damage-inducible protein DinB
MKKVIWFSVSLLLPSLSSFILAQSEKLTPAVTASQVLEQRIASIEQEVVPAAAAMPAEKYGFAPSNGEFAGVRTFAEEVKHLAAANYQLGSRALGEKPPAGTADERAPDSVKTRAEILAYLQGSFACLHRAAASVDATNAVEPLPGTQGTWQRTRLGLIVDAIAHTSNHYGQMVEYLRMNGIVPPASR